MDGYRDASQWLDDTIGCQQVGEVVSRALDFTANAGDKDSLRHAISYYVTANIDVDVELSDSIPVSGLQLLAFLRFVTQRGEYSRRQWEDMCTERQVRLLVEDIGVETAVPAQFTDLVGAQSQLASSGARPRDALGLIVKMRNIVTHPARDQPGIFLSTSGGKQVCSPVTGCVSPSSTWSGTRGGSPTSYSRSRAGQAR